MPPAPGLLTTTTVWPTALDNGSAMARATMSLRSRAAVTATTAPLVAAAIWASGGANSFLGPLLLFTSLFIAYFFPPRLAWPLVALFAGVYATPLLYDPIETAVTGS